MRELVDQRKLEYKRDRLLEQLQREKEDLAALSQFTTNAISTLNLNELLNMFLDHTNCYIERAGRIPYPKGGTWKMIIDGKARYCADVDGDKEKFL